MWRNAWPSSLPSPPLTRLLRLEGADGRRDVREGARASGSAAARGRRCCGRHLDSHVCLRREALRVGAHVDDAQHRRAAVAARAEEPVDVHISGPDLGARRVETHDALLRGDLFVHRVHAAKRREGGHGSPPRSSLLRPRSLLEVVVVEEEHARVPGVLLARHSKRVRHVDCAAESIFAAARSKWAATASRLDAPRPFDDSPSRTPTTRRRVSLATR